MESTSIWSIDAVTLVGVPEGQLPAKQHIVKNIDFGLKLHQDKIHAVKRGIANGNFLVY